MALKEKNVFVQNSLLRAFTELRKAAFSYVISAHAYATKLGPTRRIFIKFDV